MKKLFWIQMFVWFGLVLFSLAFNMYSEHRKRQNLLIQTARGFFDHIVYTRAWNAAHGGVYVPITDETKPNLYLKDQMRDIKIDDDLTLTKINPAFMTRQISEIVSKHDGVKFHITSLKPIRPQNKADSLETLALNEFESGKKEFIKTINGKEGSVFFYMAPLSTENSCLKCHAKQGYEEGDIRGGISIWIPFKQKSRTFVVFLTYGLLGLAGVIGIIFFSKKIRDAYEIIKKQAIVDMLTEIPNRRSFAEFLVREYKRSKRDKHPISVIICDIDFFKNYNDTYGHIEGDWCLKEVAAVIKDSLKRPTDFCARYGGEEFVIVLPNTDSDGAYVIAEQIRINVEKMYISTENIKHKLTISLGVASCTIESFDRCSHEELVKFADRALYKAKENGRNRVEKYIN